MSPTPFLLPPADYTHEADTAPDAPLTHTAAPGLAAPRRLLLVGGTPDDAAHIAALLARTQPPVTVDSGTDLPAALDGPGEDSADVLLLDLAGRPGEEAAVVAAWRTRVARPLVALLPASQELTGEAVVEAGAVDYLVKEQLTSDLLGRALRYAYERARLEGVLRDSARQVAALSASEATYRDMFERNRAIKLLIDPASGAIVEANPAACAYYGYSRAEFRQKRITDLNRLPADEVAAEMARAAAEERTYFIFRHRLASGEIRDVEVHSSPIEIQGRRLLYSIIHDITERRRTEDEIRRLNADLERRVSARTAELQEVNATLQKEIAERERVEAALRVRAQQQAAVAELGQRALGGLALADLLQEAAALVARTLEVEYCQLLELLPGDGGLLLRAGVGWRPGLVGQAIVGAGRDSQAGYTLLAGTPVVVADLRRETRFSGPSLLHDHGVVSGLSVPIEGPAGSFGALGAHSTHRRDFTGDDVHFLQAIANVLATAILRGRSQEDLARHRQELERALQLRDEFLSIASHELKTPITSIKAYAQLLSRQMDPDAPERTRRALRTIDLQADRLTALINELLDISRIESGRLALQPERIDLAALVPEVMAPIELLSETHRFAITVAGPPPVVLADRERVRQVLINLLTNAIKYSPEGGAVEVRLSQEGDRAVVAIQDHGIGIPADQIPHIFERFYRARNVTSLNYGGLGLGLHLSREIAERHGGALWVESHEGAGSTFYFALPLAPPTPNPG